MDDTLTIIKNNPSSIINIKDLNDEIVLLALKNGYIPKKEDFIINPKLKDYKILLDKALLTDSSVILFYSRNKLTDEIVTYAFNHGYIPKKEDLLENKELTHSSKFMKEVIKYDPRLIVLVAGDCLLLPSFIKEVFTKYKISEEDLITYPELRKNTNIMNLLPEYKIYYAYLNSEEKRNIIINYLKNGLDVTNLPFLDSNINGLCNKDKLKELIKYFKLNISEDINTQKKYYNILDKIIDGISNIRYLKSKNTSQYPDIITLNNKISLVFNKVLNTRDYTYIDNLAKELYLFTNKTISLQDITNNLYNFFDSYMDDNILHIELTSNFCNKILNYQRNTFLSITKQNILNSIISKLKLSKRKILSLTNGLKINKVANLLKNNNLKELNINEEEIQSIINNTKNIIINNKDIKKLGITINSIDLDKLINEYLFLGNTDKSLINNLLNINNKEVINYIYNKILQIRYKLSKNIKLEDNELINYDYSKLPKLNYSTYLILDKERYLNNIADILLNLDDNLINKILDSKELLKEVMFLLPLVNIIKEFDTKAYINIISNYKRIKERLSNVYNYDNIDITNLIYKKFDEVINLGNAYNSVDNITVAALGSDVIDILGEEHSNEYADIYLKMLPRKMGAIPGISLQYKDYYLESGLYTDANRLVIGKKPNDFSCIDLFNKAGVNTYKEALLDNTGDVILIRDKDKKVVSRILVFRRGNIINMATGYNSSYPIEMYEQIAEQMMSRALSSNDDIDYIFVDSMATFRVPDTYKTLTDASFINNFPHGGFTEKVVLLTSKNMINGFKDKEININYDTPIKPKYFKLRKDINYNPSESEITKLRALKILMEQDLEKKEFMKRNFEPFYIQEYSMVVCGEDWYLAIKNDNTLEEVILPTADTRSNLEIDYVKNNLINKGKGL